jgi:hypothetical protein
MRDLNEQEIDVRKSAAGRFGFVLGCVAAVLAFAIELFIAPKPLSPMTMLTAGLMAALNVPLGIVLGLLGERMTRRQVDDESRR